MSVFLCLSYSDCRVRGRAVFIGITAKKKGITAANSDTNLKRSISYRFCKDYSILLLRFQPKRKEVFFMEQKQSRVNACFTESLRANLEKIKVLANILSENLFGQNLPEYSLKERLGWFEHFEKNNEILFNIMQDYIFETLEQVAGLDDRLQEVQGNESTQI